MYRPLKLCLLAVAVIASAPSRATVIDFSNTGCSGNGGLNCLIPQTYGDTVDVDVSYRTLSATTGQSTNSGLFVFGSYGDLANVVYGGADGLHYIAEITLAATEGKLLSLRSFDVATYSGRASSVPISIFDLSGHLLSAGRYATTSPTHASITPMTDFLDGVIIRWGPDSYNVGLDNISYETRTLLPVPEPAEFGLMLAGVGGMGLAMRRYSAGAASKHAK